jgi:hypothetical protein
LGGVFEGDPCTWEEHIRSINDSWLKYPVGMHQAYSNAGMDIVAYALERITGKSYPEYVQEVLGDPLGITFHYITTDVCEDPVSAKGHLGASRSACATPVGLGCGHAHLSIEDQARFVRFLLNVGDVDGESVLESKYIEMLRSTDREGGYGLGTFIAYERGHEIPHHPGGGFGLASEMYWVPEYDIGVAVLCNQEYQSYLSELAKKTLSRLMGLKGAILKSEAAPLADAPLRDASPGRLESLVGVYGGIMMGAKVKLSKGSLVLEYSGKDVKLLPRSDTVFSAGEHGTLAFGLESRSDPAHMKLHSPAGVVTHMDYWGRPPEGLGPDKGEWGGFEGLYMMNLYASEAIFGAVKVEDDGYMHIRLWGDERLYENKSHPNHFFQFKGETIVFEGDRLLYDNIPCKRIDDPTDFFKRYEASGQNKIPDWSIDQAVDMLCYLGKEVEAEKVKKLKQD